MVYKKCLDKHKKQKRFMNLFIANRKHNSSDFWNTLNKNKSKVNNIESDIDIFYEHHRDINPNLGASAIYYYSW